MAEKKLKVGVIGAGNLARSVHFPSLAEIEFAEVVAVCDLIEERAKERAAAFAGARTYKLLREMFDRETLDAVFVIVEPSNLFRVVMNCLDAGVPTYMEKPPGVTSDQCRALWRKSRAAGVALQVGFNRRHIPVVRRVVEIMRETTTINQVVGRFMKCGAAAFDAGGMNAFECDTIHAIDLVRHIAGARPVKAATARAQFDDVVPNIWNSVVAFENGVTGVIQANYQTAARFHTFEIHGPGASAFLNLGFGGRECEASLVVAAGKAGYSLASKGAAPVETRTFDGRELAGGDEFHRFYGFYHEDRHFLECVRDGRRPETDIEDAVKTFEMVDMLTGSVI